MPVAEPFSFKGLGNGFLFFEFTKINKLDYEYALDMTLAQVTRLYYNIYSVSFGPLTAGAASLPAKDETSVETTDVVIGTEIDFSGDNSNDATEPINYRCSGERIVSFHAVVSAPTGPLEAAVEARWYTPNIVKFYAGDTDDEANHTGWGVDRLIDIYAAYGTPDDPEDPIEDLNRPSQILFASYGELKSYVPTLSIDSWWGLPRAWYQGNPATLLGETAGATKPTTATQDTISGFPIYRFKWSGGEQGGTVSNPSSINFYTYP